ncbi:MAG TPA: aldehyde dehydrogenase family protein, partial [Solirubrobacteraceae bacterium]|nr:aldehyde dehydrogenase family protein [Solirubrobacteraceae bacterium]
DADLAHAVDGALWGAFANAGQSGAGMSRVYVLRDVAERFESELVAGARRLRLGSPLEWTTDIGPLLEPAARDRVIELVGTACDAGAQLRCGGAVDLDGLAGAFYAPAVLTGVDREMGVIREDVPGPVLSVVAVDSLDQAVELANDPPGALGASVWTLDRATGERLAAALRAAKVGINDHPAAPSPRQVSLAFRAHVSAKLRVWEPSRLRDRRWYPYDETLARAARATVRYLYGRESDRPRVLREDAIPALRVARRLARDALRRQ